MRYTFFLRVYCSSRAMLAMLGGKVYMPNKSYTLAELNYLHLFLLLCVLRLGVEVRKGSGPRDWQAEGRIQTRSVEYKFNLFFFERCSMECLLVDPIHVHLKILPLYALTFLRFNCPANSNFGTLNSLC